MTEGCPQLDELEQFISTGQRGDVSTHLEDCAPCRERADEIRRNNQVLSLLTSTASGTSLEQRGGVDADPPGYRVLSEIHRGAQGVVYRAEQQSTGRVVALKRLHAGRFATTAQRRRFEREVELIARLRHPNIVEVYDAGRTPDAGWYLAMELVEGEALDEHLAEPVRTRHDTDRVAKLFRAICAGVAHAHRNGVIHRDLKPSNILIDNKAEPRIVDFGLAREHDGATVTQPGEFAGTLAYAAPEQFTLDTPVDVRADVYAIGAMLYEALTGRRPHDTSGPLQDVIREITETTARSISSARGDRIVPNDLETVVHKAIERDAGRRYDSAGSLGDDLGRYLDGAPIQARPPSVGYIASKLLRRHRWVAAGAGVLLVLVTAFVIALGIAYSRASTEAAKANQIRVFLEDTLSSVAPGTDGDPVTIRQTLDEAVHWVGLVLKDQPEVEASLRTTIGNSYRAIGEFTLAEEQLVRALEIRRIIFGDRHPQTADSMNALGLLRRDVGRTEEAEYLIRDALSIYERRWGQNSVRTTNLLLNLATVVESADRNDEARALVEKAHTIRLRVHGERHADTAMCRYRLARLLEDRRPSEAALHDLIALETRIGVLAPGHPDLARSARALEHTRPHADPALHSRITSALRAAEGNGAP